VIAAPRNIPPQTANIKPAERKIRTRLLPGSGLIGTFASVAGNEAAIRFGRKQLIVTAMLASIVIGATIGFVGSTSYGLAAALLTVYGIVIWLDSSSFTAGTAGTVEPSRRGATLAVRSMLGYGGGFVGPLLVGWTLDLSSIIPVRGSADGPLPHHILGDPTARAGGRQGKGSMRTDNLTSFGLLLFAVALTIVTALLLRG